VFLLSLRCSEGNIFVLSVKEYYFKVSD
jgi:hypothetical protein